MPLLWREVYGNDLYLEYIYNEANLLYLRKTITLFFDAPGVDKIQVTESKYEYNLQDYPVKKGNTVKFEYK